jgi:enoyl-CoA hydratase/carnithine racemase
VDAVSGHVSHDRDADTSRWIDPDQVEEPGASAQVLHERRIRVSLIRGRARGLGSEFALACDLRFASREKAQFGQPEVGTGLVPRASPGTRAPARVSTGATS